MKIIKNVIINLILPVFVIGFLLAYLFENRSAFVEALDASIGYVLLLIFLVLLTWVINNLQTLFLLRAIGLKINFFECLIALVAMILGNYIPGRFGTILRMQYFKKVHNLEYSKFSGIILVRIVLLIILTSILGAIGLIGHGQITHNYNMPLLVPCVLFIIGSFGLFLIPDLIPKMIDFKQLKLWNNLTMGFNAIRNNKGIFIKLVLLIIFQFLVVSARLYVVFNILGIEITFWLLLMIGPISIIISLINITPGNLGLREWAIGAISAATGTDFQGGIFVGTLDRGILMLCTFAFGSIAMFYIIMKIKQS